MSGVPDGVVAATGDEGVGGQDGLLAVTQVGGVDLQATDTGGVEQERVRLPNLQEQEQEQEPEQEQEQESVYCLQDSCS